jgi:transposase
MLGHEVRLVPPQYVKPYVKGGKNGRDDAEAICEASGRPGMHFVPVKSMSRQAESMVLKVRESLVGQRTRLTNALRGHAAEAGVITDKSRDLLVRCRQSLNKRPPFLAQARDMAALPGRRITDRHPKIKKMDAKLTAMHKPMKSANVRSIIPTISDLTSHPDDEPVVTCVQRPETRGFFRRSPNPFAERPGHPARQSPSICSDTV